MPEKTTTHSIDWRAELEDAISLLEYRGDEPFIRGQVISRLQDAQVAIYEQFEVVRESSESMGRALAAAHTKLTEYEEQLEALRVALLRFDLDLAEALHAAQSPAKREP